MDDKVPRKISWGRKELQKKGKSSTAGAFREVSVSKLQMHGKGNMCDCLRLPNVQRCWSGSGGLAGVLRGRKDRVSWFPVGEGEGGGLGRGARAAKAAKLLRGRQHKTGKKSPNAKMTPSQWLACCCGRSR